MVIAGAGGHGLEVRQTLIQEGINPSEIFFFDENATQIQRQGINGNGFYEVSELKKYFEHNPLFVLGVGNPIYREKLFYMLTSLGGSAFGIGNVFTSQQRNPSFIFDLMPFSFIGPDTKIGQGVLINTRAHIHHECLVGDFSEIGPGAMLLGASKIGRKCRIGAGAIILPEIEIGDEVIVGAGAVVTKNVKGMGKIVKGIPAK